MLKKYDTIVIGFGKGGKTLAGFLKSKNEKVALIEKSKFMYGGTCINIGCIPTKKLYESSNNKFSYNDSIISKDNLVSGLREANYNKLINLGVDIYLGEAHFISNYKIKVENEILEAEKIIINTGTKPFIPKIEGIDNSKNILTSTTIMEEKNIPKKLAILGAGYIGLEFAGIYNEFGSDVTVIDIVDNILPKEDEDVRIELKNIMEEAGIKFKFETNILKVEDGKSGLKIYYSNGEVEIFDKLLLSVGREPVNNLLKLENTDIQLNEKGYIVVNDKLETNVKNVYAVGDCKGGPLFTYISLDDFRIIKDQLYGNKSRTTKDRENFSYSLFTITQFARTGLSEKELKLSNIEYELKKIYTNTMVKAKILENTKGFIKVMVSKDGYILGASLICPYASEIVNILSLAIKSRIKFEVIKNHIYTHPTMTENLNDL